MEYTDSMEFSGAKIKVIGVGEGGINAVNHMIDSGLSGVDFIAADTDARTLATVQAVNVIPMGSIFCGTYGDPDVGRRAAEESLPEIKAAIGEADLVFVVAGMGGGVGSGAGPIIAQAAAKTGALTISVASSPCYFEGVQRRLLAETGITELLSASDSLIAIPYNPLLCSLPQNASVDDFLHSANEALHCAVKGLSDLIVHHGLICFDFADVQIVMGRSGGAVIGIGTAEGKSRAYEAANQALNSPLLAGLNIGEAQGVLINITHNSDITIEEIGEATGIIQNKAHEDARIFFSTVFDEAMGKMMRITIVASGYTRAALQKQIDLSAVPHLLIEELKIHLSKGKRFAFG